MTYKLYIGDRTFSSWSLRGWLMLEKFGLDYETHMVGLYSGTYRQELAHLAPARTVPAMQTPEGYVLSDSLAMAETLVERHPDLNLYPRDGAARALARTITHEMHASFMPLREACPNMITHVWEGFEPSDAVRADLARIQELWALARARHGQNGPWLFGEYSLADVFYAPVALRITAFDLPVSDEAQRYVDAHLADPAFLTWRKESKSETYDPWPYPMDLGRKPWPGDVS
ncbi:glutathione S-transferase [Loktanella sp. S4079]|uniref:glutathione S-transferase n=1 Tax=Loktanella sp. S4079 TaxID=579483 RepID=UPI0005FA7ADA|nr:glutathione S-transferase [Loktanella sp. S4079]KJZ20806.1 glutathione S-transferase [Loktanella sp. S4079]